MQMRPVYTLVLTLAVMPMVLTACSSKKDLGDSDGMTIGEPSGLNQGTGMGAGGAYGNGVGGVDGSIVPGSQADLAAQAGSDLVFFDTDRHDLTPQARTILDNQARWLNTYPNLSVTVEGHADERGTREYNLALGDRRANAVKNYLIALGVDPSRLNTLSYGKEQPLVVGADGTSWSQNRRARTRVE